MALNVLFFEVRSTADGRLDRQLFPGLQFGIQGLGFGVWSLGFGVERIGFRVQK